MKNYIEMYRIISPCMDTVVDAVGCPPVLLRSTLLGLFIHYPCWGCWFPVAPTFSPPPSPLLSRAKPRSLTCSLPLQSLHPPSNKNYKDKAPLPLRRTTPQSNFTLHDPSPTIPLHPWMGPRLDFTLDSIFTQLHPSSALLTQSLRGFFSEELALNRAQESQFLAQPLPLGSPT